MEQTHEYILKVADIAAHYALSQRTVRDRLKDGSLPGVQVGGEWRCSWADVWAAEKGPLPRGRHSKAYQEPLLTKKSLGAEWDVSVRTVERWIASGLPTRNVFGSVRFAPKDVADWTRLNFPLSKKAA